MSYSFDYTQKIWGDFFNKKIGMTERESLLAPERAELHTDQFQTKRHVKERDTSKEMSRAEMLSLAETVQELLSRAKVRRA